MRHLNRYLRLPYLIGTVSSDVSESRFAAVNPQGFRDCLAALKGRTYNTTTNTITPPPTLQIISRVYPFIVKFRINWALSNSLNTYNRHSDWNTNWKFVVRMCLFIFRIHYTSELLCPQEILPGRAACRAPVAPPSRCHYFYAAGVSFSVPHTLSERRSAGISLCYRKYLRTPIFMKGKLTPKVLDSAEPRRSRLIFVNYEHLERYYSTLSPTA